MSSSLSAEMSRKVENFVDEGGVLRRVSLLERQTAIGFSGLPSSRYVLFKYKEFHVPKSHEKEAAM